MSLTEDEVDDILYAARVNEPTDLARSLTEASQRLNNARTKFEILSAAIDADSGNTALHYAAANDHTDIINLASSLVTSAAELPPSKAPSNDSPDVALGPAESDALHSFLNRANGAGNTALHWAALNGHLKAVQLLVKLGANPALTNGMGHDAVFEAERNDKEEIVKWFLAEVPGLEQAVGSAEGDGAREGNEMDVDADDNVHEATSNDGRAATQMSGNVDIDKDPNGTGSG